MMKRHIFLPIVASLCFSTSFSLAETLTDAHRTYYSTADTDMLGLTVASVGDINGDGAADYAIGSPGYGFFAGRVVVYSGADGASIHWLGTGNAISFFGMSVANAGDVNGDGVNDIVVGAPIELINMNPLGAVYVYSGANGQQLRRVVGDQAGASFGWSVAGVGDINNDGRADIAVGTPLFDGNYQMCGSVTVFSGMHGGILRHVNGSSTNASLGMTLASMGDMDGDGVAELAMGAPGAKSIFIRNIKSNSPHRTFTSSDSDFGRYLSNTGDLTGDGIDDLIVGLPAKALARVYDADSKQLLTTLAGPNSSSFGRSVHGIGDVNGDNVPDLFVGAPTDEKGRATVFSGADFNTIRVISGNILSRELGASACRVDDVNNDGIGDFVLGDPGNVYGNNAGAAYVFLGAPSTMEYAPSIALMGAANPLALMSLTANADEEVDLIAVSTQRFDVHLNIGNSTFAPPRPFHTGSITSAANGNFNLDKRRDVVVASPRCLTFFRNTGTNLLYARESIVPTATVPTSLVSADFNGDLQHDIAAIFANERKIGVWIQRGVPFANTMASRFASRLDLPTGPQPSQLVTARIDKDNRWDLAVLDKSLKNVTVFIATNQGKFARKPPIAVGPSPIRIAFGDFNADSHTDLAILTSQGLSIRNGFSNGGFGPIRSYSVPAGAVDLATADINRDGYLDILLCHFQSGQASILTNDGTGTFIDVASLSMGTSPRTLLPVDIDRDGDLDIAATNLGLMPVKVFKNMTVR